MRSFRNREHAGRVLAEKLESYAGRADALVLGLPRGGVPVAFEVARQLNLPLDVFLVRKLGVPGREELAMGAIAPGGVRVMNSEVVEALQISEAAIEAAVEREKGELDRRWREYPPGAAMLDARDRTVILVDDGLATGSTMRAGVKALRRYRPARIVVAVPTAAPDTCRSLQSEADEVVCLLTPEPFHAVGRWYEEFDQVTDDEVRDLLARARPARG